MYQEPMGGYAGNSDDGISHAERSTSVLLHREPTQKPPSQAPLSALESSINPATSRLHESVHQKSLAPALFSTTKSPSRPHTSPQRPSNSNVNIPHSGLNERGSSPPHTEKGSLKPPSLARGNRRSTPDLEKGPYNHRSMRSPSSNTRSHHTTITYAEDDDEEDPNDPKRHAIWILIYLSLFLPLFSAATAFYALLSTFFILLFSPLCLCTTQQPLRTHLARFLTPPLRYHLSLISSIYDTTDATSPSGMPMLVLINILAPVIAIGVCMAAWVAASFWFFAAILGNPDGKDDRNDGRAAAMGVRRIWEKWLVRGLN